MRISFVIADCGYDVLINEFDPVQSTMNRFSVALFWRRRIPRITFRLGYYGDHGSLQFMRYSKEGKGIGWRFQAPIQRIEWQ